MGDEDDIWFNRDDDDQAQSVINRAKAGLDKAFQNDNKRKSVSFYGTGSGAGGGGGDDDEDDDDDDNGQSSSRRPVTTIKKLKSSFDTDPEAAIRDNVPPFVDQSQLEELAASGQLQDAADWYSRSDRITDELWKNKEFVFIKLLEGYTQTEDRRPVSILDSDDMPVSVGPKQLQQQAGATVVEVDKSRNIKINVTEGVSGASSARGPIESAKPGFFSTRPQSSADHANAKLLKNALTVMDTTRVMGKSQMSSSMLMAVNSGLLELRKINLKKFERAKRYHFYGDDSVMTMFAQLCGELFLLSNTKTRNRYFHDKDEDRRNGYIKKKREDINKSVEWSYAKSCFVLATINEKTRNTMQVEDDYLHAFDDL